MTVTVRKQIYLEQRQAKESGMTEAELIRRAINRQISARRRPDSSLWKRERAYIQALINQGPFPRRRKWRREDLYDRW